jgi:hypothetical protein
MRPRERRETSENPSLLIGHRTVGSRVTMPSAAEKNRRSSDCSEPLSGGSVRPIVQNSAITFGAYWAAQPRPTNEPAGLSRLWAITDEHGRPCRGVHAQK